MTTVVSLAICAQMRDEGDGWPTQAEYAAWWKISERQAQREWELFKRAFPGEESPDRIAQLMVANYGRRLAEGGKRGNPGLAWSLPAKGLVAV